MKRKELIIYFAFIRETVAHPQLIREKKKINNFIMTKFEWNCIESQEINLHTYGQLMYNKGDKTTQKKTVYTQEIKLNVL